MLEHCSKLEPEGREGGKYKAPNRWLNTRCAGFSKLTRQWEGAVSRFGPFWVLEPRNLTPFLGEETGENSAAGLNTGLEYLP